jgi:FkbM family methyltransferase
LDVRRKLPESFDLQFLTSFRPRTVLDIGANCGQFAAEIRHILPDATIHCFEPVQAPFMELKRLASRDPRLFAHNLAFAEEEQDTFINVSDSTPSSSLLPMTHTHIEAFPHTARTKTQPVHVVTLDSWASTLSLEEPLFIKLDVEGYEDRVIRGGTITFGRTGAVLMEVSFVELYKGQHLFDDIHSLMRSLRFACAGLIRNAYDESFRILYADAIFVRRPGC